MTALRESVVLSWMCRRQASAFVRHAAHGARTLCGIELGGSVPDPPGFDGEVVETCGRHVCRRALDELRTDGVA